MTSVPWRPRAGTAGSVGTLFEPLIECDLEGFRGRDRQLLEMVRDTPQVRRGWLAEMRPLRRACGPVQPGERLNAPTYRCGNRKRRADARELDRRGRSWSDSRLQPGVLGWRRAPSGRYADRSQRFIRWLGGDGQIGQQPPLVHSAAGVRCGPSMAVHGAGRPIAGPAP